MFFSIFSFTFKILIYLIWQPLTSTTCLWLSLSNPNDFPAKLLFLLPITSNDCNSYCWHFRNSSICWLFWEYKEASAVKLSGFWQNRWYQFSWHFYSPRDFLVRSKKKEKIHRFFCLFCTSNVAVNVSSFETVTQLILSVLDLQWCKKRKKQCMHS